MDRLKPISNFLIFLTLLVSCGRNSIPPQECTGIVVEDMGGYQVTDFAFDDNGYIWMMCADAPYLFKTDGDNIIRYEHLMDEPGSLSSAKINDLTSDRNGMIWVATQKGVDRYDYPRGNFEHIEIDDFNSYVISIASSNSGRTCIVTRRNILEFDSESGIFRRKVEMPFINASREPDLFFDNEDKLWICYDNRLDCFDNKYNLLHREAIGRAEVVFDHLSSIWIADGKDISILNTGTFARKNASDTYPGLKSFASASLSYPGEGIILVTDGQESICVNSLRHEVISSKEATGAVRSILRHADEGCRVMALDREGGLWCASQEKGFIYTPSNSGEPSYFEPLLYNIQEKGIRSSVQDDDHFWFLDGKSLWCYDIHKHVFLKPADLSSYYPDTLPFNLSVDKDGDLLVSGGPRRTNPILRFRVKDQTRIVTDIVIRDSREGMAAFGADGDIVLAGTGAKITVLNGRIPGNSRETSAIFNDKACYASLVHTLYDGSVLVCFTDHLPVIYNSAKDETRILKAENIRQIYFASCAEDRYGNLWLGSTDCGLFMCRMGSDELVHVDRFPDTQVKNMTADGEGNVFVTDFFGNVYMLNASDEGASRVWIESSDYPPTSFLVTLPDGVAARVSPSSYMCFSKENLSSSKVMDAQMHVIITSGKKVIASFNTDSFPSGKARLYLDRDMEGLNLHIGLTGNKYRHSTLSYIYDINRFKTGPREAFDNSFIPLYSVNRPCNKVRFLVQNNNLASRTEPFTILIQRKLNWYEIVLPVIFIALVLVSFWMLQKFRRKKREADSERLKREMTEQVNLDNIDFFANISHEFRTPLTLIHGAVSMLGSGETEKASAVIRRNTDRMLKLVSQMLDFNKLDHGVLKLKVRMEPVSDILEETRTSFEIGANIKSIHLSLNMPQEKIIGWVDRDKIEKIVYNLCSNALKYTPPGGSVTIDVRENPGSVLSVSVSDTGIGIPEEDLDAVFERFYQGESTRKAGGTGIGLYYTRALVNLHHGSIRASQRKDDEGKVIGSVFTFDIPIDEDEYNESEKNPSEDRYVGIDRKERMSEYISDSANASVSEKKPKLLIIDDDYEVVYYLKSIFSKSYNVYFRFDAMSGYKMIEEVNPDVIICDVMMVDVDGIQLCGMVKNNITMCHIPYIMLTAKSTMEDQINSLGVGADAYVVKPFNPDYLQALVKSMIDNRNRVRKMLSSSTSVTTDSGESLGHQDRAFMERMYAAMEESLQKGELDIDSVAAQLGVSRSKFYYKVKALTGQTPNDFFTTYKLNYSIRFLKERKYKIAAVAEMLGFSSASHFTALFKKKFGMLPSQYIDNETNN